jgi:hypothetical protein
MTRRRVTWTRRIAHHEAGHAVLSAALNDTPHLVSIRSDEASFGRCLYRFDARPERMLPVFLAGFAAEEVLTGSTPRRLRGPDLGFSVWSVVTPSEATSASVSELLGGCDQQLAVREIMKLGCDRDPEAIRAEFERYYALAKRSVEAVWPAVLAIAAAVRRSTELDRRAFRAAIGPFDIYTPIFAVQDGYGPGSPAWTAQS